MLLLSKNARFQRVFRWIQQHKRFAYWLCHGLMFSGPVMILILGRLDSLFTCDTRTRIVYHAFGIGFSIDNLLGIGFFTSGMLTSLLNCFGVILTAYLYRIIREETGTNGRKNGALEWFQCLHICFLFVTGNLLIVLGLVVSAFIFVVAALLGPACSSGIT